jgi:hypothetical protein
LRRHGNDATGLPLGIPLGFLADHSRLSQRSGARLAFNFVPELASRLLGAESGHLLESRAYLGPCRFDLRFALPELLVAPRERFAEPCDRKFVGPRSLLAIAEARLPFGEAQLNLLDLTATMLKVTDGFLAQGRGLLLDSRQFAATSRSAAVRSAVASRSAAVRIVLASLRAASPSPRSERPREARIKCQMRMPSRMPSRTPPAAAAAGVMSIDLFPTGSQRRVVVSQMSSVETHALSVAVDEPSRRPGAADASPPHHQIDVNGTTHR